MPRTARGLSRRTRSTALTRAAGRVRRPRRVARTLWPLRGRTVSRTSGYPARGTSRDSRPRGVPTKTTRAAGSRRLSSSATAMPGNRWPPVPPAAMRNAEAKPPSSIRVLGHVEHEPHREERDEQRRAARADEGERDPLRGQKAQHHADVDERLQHDLERQAGREVAAESVGRERGRTDAPP